MSGRLLLYGIMKLYGVDNLNTPTLDSDPLFWGVGSNRFICFKSSSSHHLAGDGDNISNSTQLSIWDTSGSAGEAVFCLD